MYHTYTICSLAEERSRGRVLDPISMGCGFEPHLKHCVVFLNMTLNILCSVLVSPRWSRRDIVLASAVYAPVCLSVCSPVLPETYLSTYLSDLVHSLHEWIVPWTVPSADPEGGAGGPDLPRKITSYIFSIGISNWNPPPRKKLDPPPPSWKMDPLGNLEKWQFSLKLTVCDCKIAED